MQVLNYSDSNMMELCSFGNPVVHKVLTKWYMAMSLWSMNLGFDFFHVSSKSASVVLSTVGVSWVAAGTGLTGWLEIEAAKTTHLAAITGESCEAERYIELSEKVLADVLFPF